MEGQTDSPINIKQEPIDDGASVEEPGPSTATKTKNDQMENISKLKKIKLEEPDIAEPPRLEVFPDRTGSDFYCKVCDSHMNSIQVWETHIKGKRHLKNTKKDQIASPTIKTEKIEGISGLYYIDTQGAPSPSPPPSPPPPSPPPPPPPHENVKYERPVLIPDRRRLGARMSQDHDASPDTQLGDLDFGNMSNYDRISYLRVLAESIYPRDEADAERIGTAIEDLFHNVLLFESRKLKPGAQEKLCKILGKKV